MNKLKYAAIILLLIVMLAACYTTPFLLIKTFYTPSGHFYMDEKLDTVNGDSNPASAEYYADIGFRDGKLYYYFQAASGALQHSGVYEIS